MSVEKAWKSDFLVRVSYDSQFVFVLGPCCRLCFDSEPSSRLGIIGLIDGKDAKQKLNDCHMRRRQVNLICKHFQRDILSEERKKILPIHALTLQYVGLPVPTKQGCNILRDSITGF